MRTFDFMAFGYSPGDSDMFVADAEKYTVEEVVKLCKTEYEHKFRGHKMYGRDIKALREPTVEDVQMVGCAYRFGMNEWPDGCYTFVGMNERGAFPVYVIDFESLKDPCNVKPDGS